MKSFDFFELPDEDESSSDPSSISNQNTIKKSTDKAKGFPKVKILAIIFAITIVCVCILLALLFLQINKEYQQNSASLPKENSSINSQAITDINSSTSATRQEETSVSISSAPAPFIPKDEWYMKLVNAQNALPQDFEVDTTVLFGSYYFDERAADYLKQMIEDSATAGVKLMVISASRSFDYQERIYNQKIVELRNAGSTQEEAEAEAAMITGRPYECEHNLSLAADIVSRDNQKREISFEETAEFAWLVENAQDYGFILRYPKDKEDITGVRYEPWHFRYVGEEQAKLIKESGLCFEEYLNQ